MTIDDPLGIVLRVLHLLAAITAVGGAIFMRFALLPSVRLLAEDQRKALHDEVRARWSKLIMASISILLVSGLANFFLFRGKAAAWDPSWRETYNTTYQILFGIKFLIALVIFFIASSLAGRGAATQRFRDNARFWLSVNLVLALIIVAISATMRSTHAGPNPPAELKQVAQ